MANDLQQPDKDKIDLDLEERLTPEETLLAKSILVSKLLHGSRDKLNPLFQRYEELSGDKLTELAFKEYFDRLMLQQYSLLRQYAEQLGVSQERFAHLNQLIYSRHTTA